MSAYAQFPKQFHRNVFKELDYLFWTIIIITALASNTFILYMKDIVYIPSLEDKQKYLETLYRIKTEPSKDLVQKLIDQEEQRRLQKEKEIEEAKEQKVEEVRKERAKLTDEERRRIRQEQQNVRESRTAERRMRAASMFAAAGVQQGGGGIGGSGIGGSGSGGRNFAGIVGGSRGIYTGQSQTMGGLSKVVAGGALDAGAGEIDIREVEAGDIEAGDLAGGIEMEDIEAISGEGANNVLRSTETLNSIIQSKYSSIQRCYEKYRRKDPSLNGRLTIKFTILSNGRVDRITIMSKWSNEKQGVKVEDCVRRRVGNWRFDPIEQGDVTVEFPMSFY